MCGSPHNIIVKMGQHFSKKSIKKDCPLGDNEKKLQFLRDIYTRRMDRSTEKMSET